MIKYDYYISPIGEIFLEYENEELISLTYSLKEKRIFEETSFSQMVKKQLEEYFNLKRRDFTIPLREYGSELEREILKIVKDIEYGSTMTYQDIAEKLGNKYLSRFVGRTNHFNKFPIIIPCHRVIGKNKTLIGYNGGLEKKIYLLRLEGVEVDGYK